MLKWKRPRIKCETNNDDNETVEGEFSLDKLFGQQAGGIPQQGNCLYFYSDITKELILNLNKQIDDTTKQLQIIEILYGMESNSKIKLYINSDGGDVCSALSVVDRIQTNPIPIDTYCEGFVASASTLISISGRKRYITKNSCMLIHQLSSEVWGPYSDIEQHIQNLEILMKTIKRIYLTKTKFTEKELNILLKKDMYIEAKDCKKWGLVDEIL